MFITAPDGKLWIYDIARNKMRCFGKPSPFSNIRMWRVIESNKSWQITDSALLVKGKK